MNIRGWLLSALLLVGCCAPVFADEWVYTVRPGDEIWNIASKYCGSASFASRIIKFNQLANERAIRPGSRLKIPIAWLVKQPIEAKVVSVRGGATLHKPAPEPVRVGQDIFMGYRITTADGTVAVGLADGSSIIIAPESDILFNIMTAYSDTGMVDTHLRLARGRSTTQVIKRHAASRFRMSSPAGTAAVRGTEFRVAVSGTKTLTETLGGEVGFIRDTETSVPAGFGLAASDAGVAKEELLPAPTWASPPGRYPGGTVLRWQKLADAAQYRVITYLSTNLVTPVREVVTAETSYQTNGLDPLGYVIAVRGISARDIEGYDAKLEVELATQPPVLNTQYTFPVNGVEISWPETSGDAKYTIQVSEDDAFTQIVTQEQLAEPVFSPNLTPGQFFVRIKDATSTYSDAKAVTVQPLAPEQFRFAQDKLQAKLDWQSPTAQSYRFQISQNENFSNTIVDTVLNSPTYEGAMPRYGIYYVKISAIANGVESVPANTTFKLVRKPMWWLLGLFALPLFV